MLGGPPFGGPPDGFLPCRFGGGEGGKKTSEERQRAAVCVCERCSVGECVLHAPSFHTHTHTFDALPGGLPPGGLPAGGLPFCTREKESGEACARMSGECESEMCASSSTTSSYTFVEWNAPSSVRRLTASRVVAILREENFHSAAACRSTRECGGEREVGERESE